MRVLEAYLEGQHGVSLDENATNKMIVDDLSIPTSGDVILVRSNVNTRTVNCCVLRCRYGWPEFRVDLDAWPS